MKVTAKHNFNSNGLWHFGGEKFDVNDKEYQEISEYVYVTDDVETEEPEEFVSEIFPPDKEDAEEAPVKRTRRKKAED